MTNKNNIRIIIGGGGTGGHIFPALAIADGIKSLHPDAKFLFVGAENRMEMERVPKAGYTIEGLPIRGFYRKLTLKNFGVLRDYFRCVNKAKKIIKDFQPDVVVGVGGYASAPIVKAASSAKVPVLLQEQNSYAGVSNKMLAKKARIICVAYDNMEKYFPASKIVLTGNPVRQFELSENLKLEAKKHFNLSNEKPVLLVVGGSLGARSVNNAMKKNIEKILQAGVQVIWQTGKHYFNEMKEATRSIQSEGLTLLDFISRMDLAYNISDLVVSRAGALSISEICLLGKASILVPSPNVAEDHQTKNAMALVSVEAAKMIADKDVSKLIGDKVLETIKNINMLQQLSRNAKSLAKPNATSDIVEETLKLIQE